MFHRLQTFPLRAFVRITNPRAMRDAHEAGQTTAEYALIILGAAAIATLVITWATNSNAISRLFDIVIDRIIPS